MWFAKTLAEVEMTLLPSKCPHSGITSGHASIAHGLLGNGRPTLPCPSKPPSREPRVTPTSCRPETAPSPTRNPYFPFPLVAIDVWAKLLRRMVPLDGAEPATPAFSGLRKTAKSVISRSSQERKGIPGKPQERLLFLYCSHARRRRIS